MTSNFQLPETWFVNDGHIAIKLQERELSDTVGGLTIELPAKDGDDYAKNARVVKVGKPLPGMPATEIQEGDWCLLPRIPSIKFTTTDGDEIMVVPYMDIQIFGR